MITATSLNNPKFAKKIRRAFWLAKMQGIKTKRRSTEYVKNRKGNNSLRIDYYPKTGELVVFAAGAGMKNYARLILPIISGI